MPHDETVYHIVPLADLRARCADDSYEPASLASEGFVHCSTRSQTLTVAETFYRDAARPLLLLAIVPSQLDAELVYEAPAHPAPVAAESSLAEPATRFPHVYGPIPRHAILGVGELRLEGGGFVWPEELLPLSRWLPEPAG